MHVTEEVLVQVVEHFGPLAFSHRILERLLGLFNGVEVVAELVKFVLAQSVAQIDDESHWKTAVDILMGGLADLAQVGEELVFRSDHLVVLELVDEIALSMFAEEVELYLAGDLCPLELV